MASCTDREWKVVTKTTEDFRQVVNHTGTDHAFDDPRWYTTSNLLTRRIARKGHWGSTKHPIKHDRVVLDD